MSGDRQATDITARFNSDMLRIARDRRGLTQVELATATGVTQALISMLENGLVEQPSDEVVAKVASTLRYPPEFFYQWWRVIGFPHFHQRERDKLPVKSLSQIGAIINIQRQHIAKLLRSYEVDIARPIPQIDLDESGLTPEKVAERLRAYWLLPRGPITNMVEVVEGAGAVVILSHFGTALLDGISFRSEGVPALFFMNKDVSGDRFRISLAQELGHIVMHSLPDDAAKMSAEAHRFAAAFLMPASDIKSYLINAKLSTLGRVKAFWKVPIRALLERTRDLKLITDYQFRSMTSQYNKAFKEGEPADIPVEQPSVLKDAIAFHRDRLGYSAEDLARLLTLNVADVEAAYLARPAIRLVASR
jgi:Zn-dependent peptidase ImmA (M78 family)/DNA-binding XRE family transcriptional regulator